MIWILSILLVLVSCLSLFLILKISSQVNDRLSQMNNSIQEANKIISQNMGSAANIFGNVREQLGKLEETNRSIYDISRDISRLQELLRAPKFRGQLGESMLEAIISQVLPKEYYQMQYRFKTSDTVDAVVHLGGKIIPIDAKFSLENFQKMLDAQDEPQKASYHKKFMQDIKNRVDEIAGKYILPQENTYDFGFMYIPAENVYYEIIVKEDILSYCISKKIIPVSPNTFFAYLQVICLGLKGLKVEENAKEILKNLSALTLDLARFKEDFNLLGSHLSNAARKYDDTLKRMERFSDRLTNIQGQGA